MLACSAAAALPTPGSRACSSCYQSSLPLRVCAACKSVSYCSQECQKSDWRIHKGECAHHAWLWEPQGQPGTEPVGGPADGTTLLLLSRLHRGVCLQQPAPAAAAAAALPSPAQTGVYTHTLADVTAMASRPATQVPALASHLERAIDVAGRQGLWVPVAAPGAKAPTAPTAPALLRTALTFDVNDFSVTDELYVPRAAGVYPLGALLNHSCAPNCAAVYMTGPAAALALGRVPPGEAEALGRRIPGAALTPSVQVFRTLRPVAEGEELCHSYVDLALPRASRAAYLKAAYGFACSCSSCTASGGTDAVLLGRAGAEFLPPPHPTLAAAAAAAGLQLPASDRRFWVDLPPALAVGIPLTGGEASEASSCSNDFAGTPKPLKVELLVCQQLLAAGRFSELPEGKDALSGFPVKLNPEALARVKRAAAGSAGGGSFDFPALGTAMALCLGREAWALEEALGRLRQLLHPFHVQAHATVTAAFDKYVSMSDIPAAAAACEHLCAFYRTVYSGVCGAHPMLALQLFSLGDMYSRLGEMALAAKEGEEEGPEGSTPWRPSLARVLTLQRLFVQHVAGGSSSEEAAAQGAGGGVSSCGTVPVWRPFPLLLQEPPAAAAARWKALAQACHSECAALLDTAYGPTHRLSLHARELAGQQQ